MLTLQCKKGNSIQKLEQIAGYYHPLFQNTPPQSIWIGAAAHALCLSGSVGRNHFLNTLQGYRPNTEEALVQRPGFIRRYGWDMTFSPPKSVSIVWAVSDPKTRGEIELAQQEAIISVIIFIEDHYLLGRRGRNGIQKEKVELLAAAFLHFVSREGDPQIHTHVFLQNLAFYPDGDWGCLDLKPVYCDQKKLGALYREELSRLLCSLGFSIEKLKESFRIQGISEEMEKEFSRRNERIKEKIRESVFRGGRSSSIASLSTRPDKSWESLAEVEKEWEARLRKIEIDRDLIEGLRKHPEISLTSPLGF